jgi:hypothetical protein
MIRSITLASSLALALLALMVLTLRDASASTTSGHLGPAAAGRNQFFCALQKSRLADDGGIAIQAAGEGKTWFLSLWQKRTYGGGWVAFSVGMEVNGTASSRRGRRLPGEAVFLFSKVRYTGKNSEAKNPIGGICCENVYRS